MSVVQEEATVGYWWSAADRTLQEECPPLQPTPLEGLQHCLTAIVTASEEGVLSLPWDVLQPLLASSEEETKKRRTLQAKMGEKEFGKRLSVLLAQLKNSMEASWKEKNAQNNNNNNNEAEKNKFVELQFIQKQIFTHFFTSVGTGMCNGIAKLLGEAEREKLNYYTQCLWDCWVDDYSGLHSGAGGNVYEVGLMDELLTTVYANKKATDQKEKARLLPSTVPYLLALYACDYTIHFLKLDDHSRRHHFVLLYDTYKLYVRDHLQTKHAQEGKRLLAALQQADGGADMEPYLNYISHVAYVLEHLLDCCNYRIQHSVDHLKKENEKWIARHASGNSKKEEDALLTAVGCILQQIPIVTQEDSTWLLALLFEEEGWLPVAVRMTQQLKRQSIPVEEEECKLKTRVEGSERKIQQRLLIASSIFNRHYKSSEDIFNFYEGFFTLFSDDQDKSEAWKNALLITNRINRQFISRYGGQAHKSSDADITFSEEYVRKNDLKCIAFQNLTFSAQDIILHGKNSNYVNNKNVLKCCFRAIPLETLEVLFRELSTVLSTTLTDYSGIEAILTEHNHRNNNNDFYRDGLEPKSSMSQLYYPLFFRLFQTVEEVCHEIQQAKPSVCRDDAYLSHYLSIALQEALSAVFCRAPGDKAGSAAASVGNHLKTDLCLAQLLMFFTSVLLNPKKGELDILSSALRRTFAETDASASPVSGILAYVHALIVKRKQCALLLYFLPPLRTLGMDDGAYVSGKLNLETNNNKGGNATVSVLGQVAASSLPYPCSSRCIGFSSPEANNNHYYYYNSNNKTDPKMALVNRQFLDAIHFVKSWFPFDTERTAMHPSKNNGVDPLSGMEEIFVTAGVASLERLVELFSVAETSGGKQNNNKGKKEKTVNTNGLIQSDVIRSVFESFFKLLLTFAEENNNTASCSEDEKWWYQHHKAIKNFLSSSMEKVAKALKDKYTTGHPKTTLLTVLKVYTTLVNKEDPDTWAAWLCRSTLPLLVEYPSQAGKDILRVQLTPYINIVSGPVLKEVRALLDKCNEDGKKRREAHLLQGEAALTHDLVKEGSKGKMVYADVSATLNELLLLLQVKAVRSPAEALAAAAAFPLLLSFLLTHVQDASRHVIDLLRHFLVQLLTRLTVVSSLAEHFALSLVLEALVERVVLDYKKQTAGVSLAPSAGAPRRHW
ncbi:hypothetical protein AGDE_13549 [Angomonas deanei]|uniref:Uncharacterized protein n=1 Tax=Angomonas deanei TaxID=59799 RepID=A0A7G2CF88_9TRYP|nr:hypothetical protein AGDE_13549 [Angomonas deanei]CAD2217363.1 hypothetical protein, conserved [Angomonas deanei]|eukprot:EPY22188.1 hypothetical protein AGDE_13549 [Angomonas deanei]